MKIKRQRRQRRTVRFYTTCYGFRKPYKVVCDGTFIHHLIVNRIAPADKALSNILSSPVQLFTTKCVMEELKRLGKSYAKSLQAAHLLITARCEHDKVKSAEACIRDVIGENNSEHFFVATQDGDMRKNLEQVPGVPLIFALRNALLLEQPSAYQRGFAKASEEKHLYLSDLERKLLKERASKILVTTETEGSDGVKEDKIEVELEKKPAKKTHVARNGMTVKDRPQFKRKKAKGPNPLSCKKKKNQENPNPSSAKESKAGEDTPRNRNRKRKRSRKGKNLGEADNQ